MQKFYRFLTSFLVLLLVVSVIPQNALGKVSDASRNLIEIELNQEYYVEKAIPYEDGKLFLFGAEYGKTDKGIRKKGKIKLVMRKGNKTTVVIPETEFHNSYAEVAGDNKARIYISKWDYKEGTSSVYIVNKNTLKYEIKEESEFKQDFYEVLGNNNKEFSEYDYQQLYVSDSLWLVMEKTGWEEDVDIDLPGEMVFVNAEGALLTFQEQYSEEQESLMPGLASYYIDTHGNLFYIERSSKELVVVQPDGTTSKFPLPSQVRSLEEIYEFYVDKYNRVFVYGWDENTEISQWYVLSIHQAEKSLYYFKSISDNFMNLIPSEDGTLWYQSWVESDNWDENTFNYGYFNDDSESVDVYTSTNEGNYDIYNNSVVIYNEDGYAFSEDEFFETKNGWVKDNGKWYYFKSNVKQTGWIRDGNKWYLLDINGVMQKGWKKSGPKWYFLESNGAMKTGWLKESGKWYFLSDTGAMQTGWLKSGHKWYFTNPSGAMQMGWLKSENKWYHLGSSGAMDTGWKQISGKWYFFYPSGIMAANTVIQGYKLDKSGVWVK
jgi:glucan-binding YG repeat protein